MVKEIRLIHKENDGLKLSFQDNHTNNGLVFFLDASNLKRTLSNLITNSIEACDLNGEVTISISNQIYSLIINIEDTGHGFPNDSDPSFERGFTTKPNGNGFGLSSAKLFIESLGGSIKISSLKEGTLITLTIPSKQLTHCIQTNEIVLIDDDPLVRFNWTRQGQKKGILVHAFEGYNSFVELSSNFNFQTPIYIDSNLGQIRGELLAEGLVKMGFAKIILTTGQPPKTIVNTKWISAIVGKGFESAVLMNV